MASVLAYLREFNLISVIFRLLLTVASAGIIGYGRSKKQRAAGLRTYVLISIGSALSILIALYEYEMLCGPWAYAVESVGMKFDATRFAAQVISGIGFLGAGSIISVAHQQMKGLTTATGLFATVCMALAIGAGFYEAVFITLLLLILVMDVMDPLEVAYKRRIKNITIYVEFSHMEDINTITQTIEAQNARVFDIDLERMKESGNKRSSAIFTLKLSKTNSSHSGMLSSVAELPCVYSIQELIS